MSLVAAEREEDAAVRAYYERMPYSTAPAPHTHPANLAVRAFLSGLEPAPVGRCRVLELGCADGGNLIAMAEALPGSRFVGIDLVPRQIAAGRSAVAALGLDNVELVEMSILDVGPDLGSFDYVIVHGVYSWVSAPVQEKILAVCREHLAPAGVAYVSYNTYPGWHLGDFLREMMLYVTREIAEPEMRLAWGSEFVRLIASSTAGRGDGHAEFLRWAVDHLDAFPSRPEYLLHEHFERSNRPLYFHQFMARAEAHALQYLEEAESDAPALQGLEPAMAERLWSLAADRVELEQYLDFVRNRRFRRTLLCHAAQPLDPDAAQRRVPSLFAASMARPAAAAPDLDSTAAEPFEAEAGDRFSSDHPAVKHALARLGETWPGVLGFAELLAAAPAGPTAEGAEALAAALHTLFRLGVLELFVTPPRRAAVVAERPLAATVARHAAAAGPFVPTLRHRLLRIDDAAARHVLRQLDGRRDRATLAASLPPDLVHDGEGGESADQIVERRLRDFLDAALLLG